MRLASLSLKGFRNFRDCSIAVANKTLIIGANDVGKTNLLYAMRLVLDRSLSELDLEPRDSDFYVFEETNEIVITLSFIEVTDECVVAKMKDFVSEDAKLLIRYVGKRDPVARTRSYCFFAGKDEASLTEIQGRFYTKVLSLQCIDSTRDLSLFMRSQKRHLLEDAKEARTVAQVEADKKGVESIGVQLGGISSSIAKLTYISSATQAINTELGVLSLHHETQSVEFDPGTADAEEYVNNLQLISKIRGKKITVGGDGRNNQIFFAVWASRFDKTNPLEVTLFCIEEPESHLHPHQQRKLASYLAQTLPGQVFITSHSPQIACEFAPSSIVRLCTEPPATHAANDGCGDGISVPLLEFGYRLNILPAESFFATVVVLVEGPSEVMFYKALARSLSIDLDRLNISIVSVDGVGFEPYIKLLKSLMICWVVRTDNDISKIPKKELYRCTGLSRALSAFSLAVMSTDAEAIQFIAQCEAKITGLKSKALTSPDLEHKIRTTLRDASIFVAQRDLEHDLIDSALKPTLVEYFGEGGSDGDLLEQMQHHKATFMFEFVHAHQSNLGVLANSPLAEPLLRASEIARALDA